MPIVSVILPTHNRAHYLRDAIESVLAQTYQDWELIVIDDGSTDTTRSVVEGYVKRDPRISYHGQSHQGVSAARNAGIRLASGRYIGFLDDDDLWLPEKLTWQLETLNRHPTAPWIFCDGQLINAHGDVLRPVLPQQRPAFSDWVRDHRTQDPAVSVGPLHALLLTGNCLAVPAVMVARDCVAQTGMFNEAYLVGEDYDLWLRLAHRYPAIMIQRPLIQVRVHDGAASGGADERSYLWHEATARVLEAHLTQVPREQRADVRRMIAYCTRLAGWDHLRQGDGRRARPLLLKSLRYRWTQPKIVAYLVASYWPSALMASPSRTAELGRQARERVENTSHRASKFRSSLKKFKFSQQEHS